MSQDNDKKMTNRDHAKNSALLGYNAIMASCQSILAALTPYQDQIVQSVQGGKNVVSDEVYLFMLAGELLAHAQQALGRGGFMRGQAPKPADAPAPEPAKPRLLVDDPKESG